MSSTPEKFKLLNRFSVNSFSTVVDKMGVELKAEIDEKRNSHHISE